MVTTGFATVFLSLSDDAAPSSIGESTAPKPVASTIRVSPALAGCVVYPVIDPAGAAMELSALIAMAFPTPGGILKMPGALD